MKTKTVDGIQEVHPEDLPKNLKVIDVRRADEFFGELGHIENAELVTLGPELADFLSTLDKETELVFVCKVGGRSAQATAYSQNQGFKKVYNLAGGMVLWNQLRLPISKD